MGLNSSVTNEDYHADREFISSSVLKTIYNEPERYIHEYVNGNKEIKESPALDEGTSIHSLLLEAHLFDATTAIFKGDRKQGAEWNTFKLQNSGKILLSEPQLMRVKAMEAAFRRRPEAVSMINESDKEVTICVELNGVKVKIRADALCAAKQYIADIKSSRFTVDAPTFAANAYSKMLGYDISAALYVMAAEAHFGIKYDFYFIPISKQDYVCNVFKASDKMLQEGRAKCVQALEALKIYRETGKFPVNANTLKNVVALSDYEILEV